MSSLIQPAEFVESVGGTDVHTIFPVGTLIHELRDRTSAPNRWREKITELRARKRQLDVDEPRAWGIFWISGEPYLLNQSYWKQASA